MAGGWTLAKLMGWTGVESAVGHLRAGLDPIAATQRLMREFPLSAVDDIARVIDQAVEIVARQPEQVTPYRGIPTSLSEIPVNPFLRIPNRPFDTLRYHVTFTAYDPVTGREQPIQLPIYSPYPLTPEQFEQTAQEAVRTRMHEMEKYEEWEWFTRADVLDVTLHWVQRIELTPEESEGLSAVPF